MTQYLVNRSSLDEVSLELNQTGHHESSINLKEALLDDKRSYVFAVDSLIIPLNNAPIFDLEINTELFRIQRRNVGLQLNTNLNCGSVAVAAGIHNVPEPFGIYRVNRNIYDIATLVSDLNNNARDFEYKQSRLGIADEVDAAIGLHYGAEQAVDPLDAGFLAAIAPLNVLPRRTEDELQEDGTYSFLNFKLLNDGTLVIQGSSDFWNNFYFDFTKIGMETLGFAEETQQINLLGLAAGFPPQTHNILALTRLANGVITRDLDGGLVDAFLEVAGPDAIIPDIAAAGPQPDREIAAGNMISDYPIYSQHSLFQCADQRLKITVDSHLPTMSNVLINNNKESIDRSIAEFYFEKNITASTVFDSDGKYESSKITTNIYSGQYSLIKKSSPYKKWTKLQTSYEIRFFRFLLNIFYRKYNSETNVWDISKKFLNIPDDMYWSMLLRFVSEV